MKGFFTPVARQPSAGLAVLRIVTGVIFAAHGGQKLFVWGLPGVTGAFTHMGVPLAGLSGPLVGFLEFLGGIALVLGLLTRLFAPLLAYDMLCAILLVKIKGGFFAPRGAEFELLLCAAAAALALVGPGTFSLDQVVARRAPRA